MEALCFITEASQQQEQQRQEHQRAHADPDGDEDPLTLGFVGVRLGG
jgi:hypothetical protein